MPDLLRLTPNGRRARKRLGRRWPEALVYWTIGYAVAAVGL